MGCSVVLFANLLVAVSASVNYCGARMCGNTDSHTLCQYYPGPSGDCVGYINADLNQDEKSRILTRLNHRRNEAAEGRFRGLPCAGNMLKLRWVEELSREAQRWADQCRPPRSPEEKDACRDLYSITVGQSVSSVVGEAPGLLVESMVDIWYMQSTRYKGNATYYVPSAYNNSYYGDFAQIIWAKTYMVGCGRSKFMTEWKGRLRSVARLVCNFAPRGPPPRYPLWSASEPADSCPPRAVADHNFTALCTFQQNTTMTLNNLPIEEYLLIDTVLDIENNETLNYLGSLDEIYLTRLAISTMQTDPTSSPASLQRRAVVEVIPFEDTNNNSIQEANSKLEQTTTKLVTTKKKVGLIGRPKPYNIKELSNELEDKIQNQAARRKKLIGGQDKDIYSEYDFRDSAKTIDAMNAIDGPITQLSINNKDYNKNITMDKQFNKYSEDLINKDALKEVDKVWIGKIGNMYQSNVSNEIENLFEITTTLPFISSLSLSDSDNGSKTFSSDSDEDFLTDPETVHQLQKALDLIEQSMSGQRSKPGKVRRDLDETILLNEVVSQKPYMLYTQTERYLFNDSEDKSPMYSMVMKFMPNLREYHERLKSKAHRISDSMALVLVAIFIL